MKHGNRVQTIQSCHIKKVGLKLREEDLMITFIISVIALCVGYFLYGTLVEKVFHRRDDIQTPAIRLSDGVDFVAMP